MSSLHFSAAKLSLDAQVESDQREGQRDRLRFFIRILGRKRIHDVLVDECGITTG